MTTTTGNVLCMIWVHTLLCNGIWCFYKGSYTLKVYTIQIHGIRKSNNSISCKLFAEKYISSYYIIIFMCALYIDSVYIVCDIEFRS